jgi:hypothetical protein
MQNLNLVLEFRNDMGFGTSSISKMFPPQNVPEHTLIPLSNPTRVRCIGGAVEEPHQYTSLPLYLLTAD